MIVLTDINPLAPVLSTGQALPSPRVGVRGPVICLYYFNDLGMSQESYLLDQENAFSMFF
jgi:hypothetical protein